jgi:hypothetical protein
LASFGLRGWTMARSLLKLAGRWEGPAESEGLRAKGAPRSPAHSSFPNNPVLNRKQKTYSSIRV